MINMFYNSFSTWSVNYLRGIELYAPTLQFFIDVLMCILNIFRHSPERDGGDRKMDGSRSPSPH